MANFEEPHHGAFQFADKDATALAQELFRVGLIKKEILDHLTNFSPEVPNSMKHRYLFDHVYKVTNNNKEAFMRMVEILIQFPSTTPVSTPDSALISSEHIFLT